MNSKRRWLRLSVLLGYGSLALLSGVLLAKEIPNGPAIEREVHRLMASEDVKGMALALIVDGEICHVAAYGYRNVAQRLPLEVDTVMDGASLTKTAFAYLVLQLVDEGRLDLDVPIGHYLPKPLPEYPPWRTLVGDDLWQRLTARIILTHATGLANLRNFEENRDLYFHFPPGTRFAYSGEGILVLQTVLEQGLGLDIQAEMERRIFDRFRLIRTSLKWRSDFAGNLADGYAMNGGFRPHGQRSKVRVSVSMDTTITDQARMWRGIMTGVGLSAEGRETLSRPQLPIQTARQFPPLTTDTDVRGPRQRLAAGLGVITFRGPEGLTWFKGGHNPWTGNMVICQESQKRCLVLLANSARAELIYPEIVHFILGDCDMPWWWVYGDQSDEKVAP